MAADVMTQPVPARLSSMPNTTRRPSNERHRRNTSRKPTGPPTALLRLIRYRPDVRMGATIMKPENAPANSQNRSNAIQIRNHPNAAKASPCTKPGTGLRTKSPHPLFNQFRGENRSMRSEDIADCMAANGTGLRSVATAHRPPVRVITDRPNHDSDAATSVWV
jgi:hypothetical protein